MTTEAIDKEIAREAARIRDAQSEADKAAEQLAKDPSNPELRVAVMQAQQAVAEIQVSLDALTAARVEGVKADAQEADEAYRAETLAMFNQAKALIAKRDPAGKALDVALAALRDAMATWASVNTEAAKASNKFYQRLYGGHSPHLLGMESVVLNAMADQIHEAVSRVSGSHSYFSFGHVRHTAGVAESVEQDATKSSARYLESIEGFAKTKGVI